MGAMRDKCERCNAKAKAHLPYGPHSFCATHFVAFFERRAKQTIRENKLVKYGEKIAVAVSGGKDSVATLHILNKFFGKDGLNKIEAIIIDEGIKGYRDKAAKIALWHCKKHRIKAHLVKFKDQIGTDMNAIMEKIRQNPGLGGACSYCGVFRRKLMNQKAIEISADKLATGHNLDDECQSIAMSIFGSDISRLARLGPSTGDSKKGMVPRIKPLYETPEKDIIAYCAIEGIKHYSEECCPHSWMAKRNYYRKMLNDLEEEFPGTKQGILGAYKKLKPFLALREKNIGGKIMECKSCGGPSNQSICGACRQAEKLLNSKGTVGKAKKTRGEKCQSCAETKWLK